MEHIIYLRVTKEHAKKSQGFLSIVNCPIAIALKERFGKDSLRSVGGYTVHFNHGSTYKILDHEQVTKKILILFYTNKLEYVDVELEEIEY